MTEEILDAFFGGDFRGAFCEGCGEVCGEPGHEWCPVSDDMSDKECPRHGAFKELEAIADGALDSARCVVERCCRKEGAFVR
jgi:hypothetical protein